MQTQMRCSPNPVKWLVSLNVTSTLTGKIQSLVVGDQRSFLLASIYLSNGGKVVL